MSRLRATLVWSVIAAAFIGPGTVTTAASAGSGFGLSLLWALLFSVGATYLLQEGAARLTLATDQNLGQLLAQRGGGGYWPRLLFGAILLGCVAYEAGNLLGALAGLRLLSPLGRAWILLPVAVAAGLLWSGSVRLITTLLAVVVAGMGVAFVWVALGADTTASQWGQGLVPRLPDDAALLTVGLIGTTIVPYNLFLATGLGRGQTVGEMRLGLAISVLTGGIITLAIMLSGTQLVDDFSFAALAAAVADRVGALGPLGLGVGLFAAGFSSAITAALAAAVTGQVLFQDQDGSWQGRGRYFRLTWAGVLAVGTLFALLDVQPVPIIILAQAVNGLILPLVAVFLVLLLSDQQLLGPYANRSVLTLLTLAVVGVVVVLGLHQLWLAAGRVFPAVLTGVSLPLRLGINAAVGLALVLGLLHQIRRRNGRD